MSRKVSKRTSKILRDCPNIGQAIESFVQDHSVGADAWRRTGVLTFDGNANLKDKPTGRFKSTWKKYMAGILPMAQ